ncbi:hypothetical protein HS088_TW02G00361 [Tripterygium wilfordii]|uniref:N-acetyltransferase domain-containing protein n=1 Tax=Tripterygium wilfordii TaxID=458696 RepID=A0A7J7DY89_TRIWF|nr:probable N-acetyltransferase HLS1-like [Tripterygium wilfordii]KAF5751348.1 hypothetical protein HS088_TW02G00361 [Tripterygium wilfordii]
MLHVHRYIYIQKKILIIMVYMEAIVRSYDDQIDRARVEDLERRCEVGPAERVFQLYTDTLGDPICRIRNSPMYKMLVAEMDKELVGLIQGSVKIVRVYNKKAKVGYVLGLRVVPIHRRKGIGLRLVKKLEEWFISSDVEYAYMATENDNEASVNLFVNKLGYVKFRTPSILVNPVNNTRPIHVSSSNIEIVKLKVEDAELMYRRFMASTDFFPDDIGNILRNKLSLGTWVAYDNQKGQSSWSEELKPKSWAMVSVWNSGELFKLRLGKAPLSCLIYTKSSRLIDKFFPWFKVIPSIPDFFNPFGFYFIYGVHREGPVSGKLVKALCQFVHNMAMETRDCKVIVTEVGGNDSLRFHIPHWKLLSCPEDLWCIKALKNEDHTTTVHELTKTQATTKALFVDPREV